MRYHLIRYKDIDLDSFDPEVTSFLGKFSRKSVLKIFGTNEKGLIILVPQYQAYTAYYIFVKEEFRHQGVAKDLIASAFAYCKRYRKIFKIKIVFNNAEAEWLERISIEMKLLPISFQRIYILYRENFDSDAGKEWVYKRMKLVVERFKSKGYFVDFFGNAPSEILNKLQHYFETKNTPGWEAPFDMNPFQINYDPDFSFICWKDNEPVSYICNERFGDSLVTREMFCFRKYFSLGVSFLPLYNFADAMLQDSSVKRCSFLIFDQNTRAKLMMDRDYAKFLPTVTVQKIYAGNAKPYKIKEV